MAVLEVLQANFCIFRSFQSTLIVYICLSNKKNVVVSTLAMTESSSRDWRDTANLGALVKEVCFDSGAINPSKYDKSKVIAARASHPRFGGIDEGRWLSLFRRAASEYIFQKDQDAVGESSRHHQTVLASSVSPSPHPSASAVPSLPEALLIANDQRQVCTDRTKVSAQKYYAKVDILC